MTLPRIALLIVGDGRDALRAATLASWNARAQHYKLVSITEVDDSMHLLGFCDAIRYGWERLRESTEWFDYVFHLEEDWSFDRAFSIAHMARLLDTEPQVVQVALRRGPEPAEEGASVVDRFPDEFADRVTGMIGLGLPARSQEWLEHRMFWTTNPGLYHRSIVDGFDWPRAPRCEARFTEMMRTEGRTFAYWGDRHDAPWITHTGQRTGRGY